MILSDKTLLIMDAGMGSRYWDNKQIEGMGPYGEMLLQYFIYNTLHTFYPVEDANEQLKRYQRWDNNFPLLVLERKPPLQYWQENHAGYHAIFPLSRIAALSSLTASNWLYCGSNMGQG